MDDDINCTDAYVGFTDELIPLVNGMLTVIDSKKESIMLSDLNEVLVRLNQAIDNAMNAIVPYVKGKENEQSN